MIHELADVAQFITTTFRFIYLLDAAVIRTRKIWIGAEFSEPGGENTDPVSANVPVAFSIVCIYHYIFFLT